jgi:hypothetical protein
VFLLDSNGYTATLIGDNVLFWDRPYESRNRDAHNVDGEECSVLFPVYNKKGEIKYYYVSYGSSTEGIISGYVQAADILVVDETFDLPDINSLNGEIEIGRRSAPWKSYDVYVLQCVLYEYGFLNDISDCDGVYGPNTAEAVSRFQTEYNKWDGNFSAHNIVVDGIYGKYTYNALCEWVETHERVN